MADLRDLDGIAEVASQLTGRPIKRTVVSDAQYRDNLIGHGVPERAADLLAGLVAASRQGEFAVVDPDPRGPAPTAADDHQRCPGGPAPALTF